MTTRPQPSLTDGHRCTHARASSSCLACSSTKPWKSTRSATPSASARAAQLARPTSPRRRSTGAGRASGRCSRATHLDGVLDPLVRHEPAERRPGAAAAERGGRDRRGRLDAVAARRRARSAVDARARPARRAVAVGHRDVAAPAVEPRRDHATRSTSRSRRRAGRTTIGHCSRCTWCTRTTTGPPGHQRAAERHPVLHVDDHARAVPQHVQQRAQVDAEAGRRGARCGRRRRSPRREPGRGRRRTWMTRRPAAARPSAIRWT